MALCHSSSSVLLTSVCFPLSLSLFSVGCHLLQLKRKKNIVRLHSSSVEFCFCVTLDDKGVKRKCPSHYIFSCLFLFTVVYLGIWLLFFSFNCL